MHLPGPLRAAVGLAASAADELKNLPDRAVELPMLAVSTALQLSLRAQQRYARLAARGDQILNPEAPPGEEPPAWATFDEPVTVEEMRRAALNQLDSLVDGVGDNDDTLADLLGVNEPADGRPAGGLFQDLFGVSDPAAGDADNASGGPRTGDGDRVTSPAPGADDGARATVTPITNAPGAGKSGSAPRKSARKTARKTATRKTATKAAPAKATKSTSTSGSSSKPTAAKAAPATAAGKNVDEAVAGAEGTAVDKPADKTAADKPVNKPRHTTPSKFDDADDS